MTSSGSYVYPSVRFIPIESVKDSPAAAGRQVPPAIAAHITKDTNVLYVFFICRLLLLIIVMLTWASVHVHLYYHKMPPETVRSADNEEVTL